MALLCPSENNPEWKKLLKALNNSRSKALTAFRIYNKKNNTLDDVPSVDEAFEIFSELSTEEKDEQFMLSSEEYKLDRAEAQISMLASLSQNVTNPFQEEVLVKLRKMTLSYKAFLNKNIKRIEEGKTPIKSVSASAYIGTSEFKGDPTKYEAFKHFGTFMHEVIERAQIISLQQDRVIYDIVDRKFFDTVLKDYRKISPFEIEDMSDDDMFEMSTQIIQHMGSNITKKFMLLPEITVVGETVSKTKVVGRIDMMMIDVEGNVHILDFKTKKLRNLFYTNPMGQSEYSDESTMLELARETYPSFDKEGTNPELRGGTSKGTSGTKRSTFDNWTLQLKVYDNILRQNDISVKDKKIVALMYQTNDEGKFIGSKLVELDQANLYSYALGTSVVQNPENARRTDIITILASKAKIKAYNDIINRDINIGEYEEEDIVDEINKQLNINSLMNDRLKKHIKDLVDSRVAEVDRNIKNLENEKNDPDLLNVLKKRKQTLERFQQDVLNAPNDSPTKELRYSINYTQSVEIVEAELDSIQKISQELSNKYFDFTISEKERNAALKGLNKVYEQSRGLAEITKVLNNIMLDLIQKQDASDPNRVTDDNDVKRRINRLNDHVQIIDGVYRKASLYAGVEAIKSLSGTSLKRLNEEAREALDAQLQILQKQYNRIESAQNSTNQKSGFYYETTKNRILSFLSKDYRERMREKLNDPNFNKLLELDRQIQELSFQLKTGVLFNDEEINDYIEGITNPQSTVYMGSGSLYGINSMIRDAISFDKVISSASNSEVTISAFAQMFKDATAIARTKTLNEFVETDYDTIREELLKTMTYEEMNNAISEWRETQIINPQTGKVETKKALYLTIPYSEQYATAYKNYKIGLIQAGKEIEQVKSEYYDYYSKTPTPEQYKKMVVLEQKLKDARKKRETLYVDYINWMIENSSLPYTEDFYKLQSLLPADIREQVQTKYFEIDTIMHDVGRGNEDMLDEDQYERMSQLRTEIKKLKEVAREQNPLYAEYLKKIDELYVYEVQQDAYERAKQNAAARYGNKSERFQRWIQENSVNRPNSDWYEAVNEKYEQLAEIFGSNPAIQALLEKRRAIRRAHMVEGVFSPRTLTDEDVAELKAIDDEIAVVKEANKRKLTRDEKRAVRRIMDSLDAIRKPYPNANYTAIMADKTKSLNLKLREKRRAENFYNQAQNPDQKAILKLKLASIEQDFRKYEEEYEKWYNRNHENKYRSIEEQFDPIGMGLPKSFNYDYLPTPQVWEDFMDLEIPSSKYTTRRLKESARNPNFLKAPDGTPMPKGFYKNADGTYSINPTETNPNNINPKYLEIQQNPALNKLYTSMSNLYFKLQKEVEGKTLGYAIPGLTATTVENFARFGIVKGIEKVWSDFKDKQLTYYGGQDDLINNVYGDLGAILRNKHSIQLDEQLQSHDVISSILQWASEANMNIAMQQVQPQTDAFINYLISARDTLNEQIQQSKTTALDDGGNRIVTNYETRLKSLNSIIETLEFERRKFIYGQTETSTNRVGKKLVNQLSGIVSFARIGFDVTNQAKNFVAGSLQTFIAAGGTGSPHYTAEGYREAWSQVISPVNGMIANYFKDYNNISNLSLDTLMYRSFNPAQKDQNKYIINNTGTKKRKLTEKLNPFEISHLLQDKGDTLIAYTTMRAVLNSHKYKLIDRYDPVTQEIIYKVDDKGEFIMVSAYEAYYRTSDGKLARKGDVDFTEQDERYLRNVIYSEIRRAQGNYAADDRTPFESSVMGKIVMFYRKYLVPTVLNKFGYARPDWETGTIAMGYWNAVYLAFKAYGPQETLKHLLLGGFMDVSNKKIFGDKLNPFFTRKLKHASRDLYAHALLMTVSLMILSMLRRMDDDEEEELSMVTLNGIRLVLLTSKELTSLTPFLGGGNEEYIRNFSTVSTYTREMTALSQVFEHLYGTVIVMMNGFEEADPELHSEAYIKAYRNAYYMRKSGPYKKGDSKLMKDFYDLTGIKNIRDFFEPENKLEQLKRN